MVKKRRTAVLLGGVLFITIFATAAFILIAPDGINSNPYRRYVSPPLLPDRTRYTFLYPYYLNTVRDGLHNPAGAMHSVRIDNTPLGNYSWRDNVTIWLNQMRSRFGYRVRQRQGSITVMAAPVPLRIVRDLRKDSDWHDVYVADARTQLRLRMYHQIFFNPPGGPQFTDAEGRIVADSLQFLPPDTRD